MKPSKFLSLSALAIPASLAFSHSALAANINWTGSNGTDWNGPGNPPWSNGTKPASGDTAVFNTVGTIAVANAVGDQVVSGMTFDTAAGSFTIGTTGGNKVTLTTGNTIQIAATLAGSNLTETIDSPIVFGSGAAAVTYNFSNLNTNASNKLVFGGALSDGTTLTTMLTLTGVNTGNNAVNGLISNGSSSALSINKTNTGTWILGNTSNGFTGGARFSAVKIGEN